MGVIDGEKGSVNRQVLDNNAFATYDVTVDANGYVWIEAHKIKRCLFQVIEGKALFKIPHITTSFIGKANIQDGIIVVEIPITHRN